MKEKIKIFIYLYLLMLVLLYLKSFSRHSNLSILSTLLEWTLMLRLKYEQNKFVSISPHWHRICPIEIESCRHPGRAQTCLQPATAAGHVTTCPVRRRNPVMLGTQLFTVQFRTQHQDVLSLLHQDRFTGNRLRAIWTWCVYLNIYCSVVQYGLFVVCLWSCYKTAC